MPPKTEYSLTEQGRKAIPVIETIREYGSMLMKEKKGYRLKVRSNKPLLVLVISLPRRVSDSLSVSAASLEKDAAASLNTSSPPTETTALFPGEVSDRLVRCFVALAVYKESGIAGCEIFDLSVAVPTVLPEGNAVARYPLTGRVSDRLVHCFVALAVHSERIRHHLLRNICIRSVS